MTAPPEARREAAIRWFAFLGGMGAFALHLVLGFYLVPFSCFLGTLWPLYGITALLAAVTVAAIALGWQRRGAAGSAERPEWTPGRGARTDRARFMMRAGIFLNGLALLIILYAGAALLVFDPCQNWPV